MVTKAEADKYWTDSCEVIRKVAHGEELTERDRLSISQAIGVTQGVMMERSDERADIGNIIPVAWIIRGIILAQGPALGDEFTDGWDNLSADTREKWIRVTGRLMQAFNTRFKKS